QALTNFANVASNYPDAHKAPDALLKMAILLKNSNQLQHAQAALTRLVQEYPDSDAAKNAAGGLASLEE
ncbi:MAG: cell division protein CpoB, partial [Desulfuromonas sp.]